MWINWKYEDFDEEPLKMDGTISHAIERSLSFIVEDSGFITKIIMNNVWAQSFLSILQQDLVKTFQIIGNQYGIRSLYELSYFAEREKKLMKFSSPQNEVYIYGAGDRARDCKLVLSKLNIKVKGYLVSDNIDVDEKQSVYCIDVVNNKNEKIVINYKTKDMKEDTEIWEDNVWQNTLCNKCYINEILSCFEENLISLSSYSFSFH